MVWNPIKQTSDVFADVKRYPKYYWMAISACWGGMLFGWDSGLIGGLLNLKSFKTSFGLTANPDAYANLQGWIVSTLQAGCFFGAMSAAFIAEKVGRRGGLFVAAFFFHLGSLLQTTCILGSQSQSAGLTQLYIGRAIGGYGVGMVSVIVPTYIAESSPKHIRGRLTGLYQLAIVTGIALSFWVNYGMIQQFGDVADREVIWRAPFALQHIPGVLLVVTMLFEKESPRWLSEKGRWDEARAVIARLSKKSTDDPDVVREAEEIRHDLEKHVRLGFGQQFKEVFGSGGAHFYRCSLPFIMMFWQQWTGVNSMNYYSPRIFQELGLNGTSAGLLGTGIYGIVKIVMTLLVLSWGMEQYGRKALLVWGGVGQALPMFYIAGYRHIREGSKTVDGASYVAIVMIYLYVTFYSFGWSVAPWPAMSETQPNHLRSLTMSIGLMSNWLFNFTISKITPILLQRIKWGTYLLFGCTTLTASLWAVFFFPETGGYKIEDMHTLFEGSIVKRSLRDNKYLFKTYNNAAEMNSTEKTSDVETSSASDRSDNEKI